MNKEKKIKYLAILKDSWRIIWNNKYLWWFGFFIALGEGFNFQLWRTDEGNWKEKTETGREEILSFMHSHSEWIMAGLVIAAIIAVILLVLRIISQAAIIKSADDLQKNKKSSFSIGFKKGRKYFWKLLAIDLILGFLTLGMLVVLFLPVAFLFHLKSSIAAVLLMSLAILIFIPLAILISFLKKYAYFYLVLAKSEIKSSIENAYQVFQQNILSSLIMALFLLIVKMIAGFTAIILIFPLILIFLPAGLIFYFFFAKTGIIIAAILGMPILILIMLLLGSAVTAFCQIAWFLFFQKIAAVKTEGINSELENKIIKEKTPSIEKAIR